MVRMMSENLRGRFGHELGWRYRCLLLMPADQFDGIITGKRQLAGDEIVEGDAEGIDIGAGIARDRIGGLLRSHEGRCSRDRTHRLGPGRDGPFRRWLCGVLASLQRGGQRGGHLQSQIVDPDSCRRIEKQIRRLDVAMTKALLVCGFQATRRLENHHGGLVGLEPLARIEQLGGRGAVDPYLCGEMMPAIAAQFTNSDQIGVVDLGCREGLACEPGEEDRIGRTVGCQQLEHVRWLERRWLRQDNAPPRTVAQKFEHKVPAEPSRYAARQAAGTEDRPGSFAGENGPLDRGDFAWFGCRLDPGHGLGEHAGVELGDNRPRAIRLGDRELEQPFTPRATGREASGPEIDDPDRMPARGAFNQHLSALHRPGTASISHWRLMFPRGPRPWRARAMLARRPRAHAPPRAPARQ